MCKNKNEELLSYYENAEKLLNYNDETGTFTWNVKRRGVKLGSKAGTYCNGYISIRVDGKSIYAHRLAWYFTHKELPDQIDHKNCLKDDNRIINLRSCNHSENMRNRGKRSNNTSGYKGVFRNGNKWKAVINIKGEYKYLGSFDSAKEASEVHDAKDKEISNEFYHKQNKGIKK